jgi:predicted transcriptional regulator
MAIHPQYAEAILDGSKQVEFRKRPLAADVTTVVIYATAPVRRLVGEFQVKDTLSGSPADLWTSVGDLGAIDAVSYRSYYEGTNIATGLVIGGTRRYRKRLALDDLDPEPAIPQSFSYLSADQFKTLAPMAMARW